MKTFPIAWGLLPTPGPRVLNGGEFGPVLRFLKTFPAARGFPPTPGRARILNGPCHGGRGWELGGQGAGRQGAEEIGMLNHWATGLRSGLLVEGCCVATPEVVQKRCLLGRSFRESFDFWCQGKVFGRVLVGSRRSPTCFLQGLAPSIVRWGVSYKGKSVKKTEF